MTCEHDDGISRSMAFLFQREATEDHLVSWYSQKVKTLTFQIQQFFQVKNQLSHVEHDHTGPGRPVIYKNHQPKPDPAYEIPISRAVCLASPVRYLDYLCLFSEL